MCEMQDVDDVRSSGEIDNKMLTKVLKGYEIGKGPIFALDFGLRVDPGGLVS